MSYLICPDVCNTIAVVAHCYAQFALSVHSPLDAALSPAPFASYCILNAEDFFQKLRCL